MGLVEQNLKIIQNRLNFIIDNLIKQEELRMMCSDPEGLKVFSDNLDYFQYQSFKK